MSEENNLSLYSGQDGLNDFPVLKAFQQYIDAEQAKSRKRMIGLSIVFGCVLIALVAIFIVVLGYFNVSARQLADRNQQLNDKLVEFAMQDRDRQLSVKADSDAKDVAIKTMTDSISQLQKQLSEQQTALVKAQAEQAKQVAQDPAEIERRIREEAERIAAEALRAKVEQERLAAEKERQRLDEIERHRRRLYPEYYARKDAEERGEVYVPAKRRPATTSAKRVLKPVRYFDADDADDDEALDDELDDQELEEITAPVKNVKKQVKPVKPETVEDVEIDKPIEYFTEDEFTIPVDVKDAKGTSFRIPLN